MKQSLRCRLTVAGLLFSLLQSFSAAAQIHYIDLTGQTLSIPGRRFQVERVLDGRRDRAGIGRVLMGLADTPQSAELAPNLVDGLTKFLQTQLPARPADEPVLLLVRELRVAERRGDPGTMGTRPAVGYSPAGTFSTAGTRPQALARVTLDCYLRRPDGYHLAGTATDTVRQKTIFDATWRHAPLLAQALQSTLSQLASANWSLAANSPARTLEDLQRVGRVEAAASYPIQQDSVRARGYYRTFLDFRNNQPVPAPDLRVVQVPRREAGWENTPEIKPLLGTERLPAKVWGFSDGTQLYIHHQGRFALLRPEGSAFGFVSLPENSSTEQLRSGNLLGAAIAASAAGRQPVHYTLEMSSGRTTLFADGGRRAAARDTIRLHVYRRRASGATPVQLLINGQAAGELPDNALLLLPWTSQTQEPRLTLAGVAGPALTFLPSFRGDVYIRVRPELGADPSKPALEIVDAKTGVFQMREIRLRQGLKK